MFRLLAVAIVLGSWAAALPAAEPLDLKSEMGGITGKFMRWTFQNKGVTAGPEYDQALAERNAGLSQLAAKAEAENSSDHLTLAELYGYLNRQDDAAREARAAVAASATDLPSQARVLKVVSDLQLADDALKAFRQWLALDVAAADVKLYLEPLQSFPSGATAMVKLLVDSGRGAEAKQAVDELAARLDKLAAQHGQAPAQAGQPFPPGSLVHNAKISIHPLRAVITMAENKQITSQPRPTAAQMQPRPTVVAAPTAPTGVVQPSRDRFFRPGPQDFPRPMNTGPQAIAGGSSTGSVTLPPFRVEYYGIIRQFNSEFSDPQQRQGEKYEAALAARNESLNQLTAKMTAAQSTDHLTLAMIYGNLELADEALAAVHRWLALDVKGADLKGYLAPLETPSAMISLVQMLVAKGRRAEAEQALKETGAKLALLFTQLGNEPPAPGQQSVGDLIFRAQSSLRLAARSLNDRPSQSPAGPVSVTVKLYTILDAHGMLATGNNDPTKDPGYQKRADLCNAAVNQLLAKALTEKPIDHIGLVRVYDFLKRPDDVARELQVAVAASGPDFKSQGELAALYQGLGRMDESLAAFHRWVAVDIAAADAGEYLKPFANRQVWPPVTWLLAAQRYDEAERAMTAWEAQLDKLQARIDQAAPQPAGPSPLQDLQRTATTLRLELRERKLAGGIQRIAGQIQFYKPLDVGLESVRIHNEYVATDLGNAELLKQAGELRDQSLGQLATAAEAAKSTEHPALASIYSSLHRYDDAVREARAAVATNATDFSCQSILIASLGKLRNDAEALAAFRQFVALEVPESETVSYLSSCPSVAESMVSSLLNAGKYAEAEQALSGLEAQLAKVKISGNEVFIARRLKQLIPALRKQLAEKKNPK